MYDALELNDVSMAVASLSAALGREGDATETRAAIIRSQGGSPLLAVLLAPAGTSISMIATTLALPRPLGACGTLH
jgi:hypothetical protein